MLMNLEKPATHANIGTIITENIPFVSASNLTAQGLALYGQALREANNRGDDALYNRIARSVRQRKEFSRLAHVYLKDLIEAFRENGTVFYDDTITELEVFPWTYMTK